MPADIKQQLEDLNKGELNGELTKLIEELNSSNEAFNSFNKIVLAVNGTLDTVKPNLSTIIKLFNEVSGTTKTLKSVADSVLETNKVFTQQNTVIKKLNAGYSNLKKQSLSSNINKDTKAVKSFNTELTKSIDLLSQYQKISQSVGNTNASGKISAAGGNIGKDVYSMKFAQTGQRQLKRMMDKQTDAIVEALNNIGTGKKTSSSSNEDYQTARNKIKKSKKSGVGDFESWTHKDKLTTLDALHKKLKDGQKDWYDYSKSLGGTPVGLLAVGAASIYIVGQLDQLTQTLVKNAVEFSKFYSNLAISSRMNMDIMPGGREQLMGIRDDFDMTTQETLQFSTALRELHKSSASIDDINVAMDGMRQTLGEVDISVIKELISLYEQLPKEQIDIVINGTGSLDDEANALMNLTKAGKLRTVMELEAKGAFGAERAEQLGTGLSDGEKQMIETQRDANKIMEDMSMYLSSTMGSWTPYIGMTSTISKNVLSGVAGVASLAGMSLFLKREQKHTTDAVEDVEYAVRKQDRIKNISGLNKLLKNPKTAGRLARRTLSKIPGGKSVYKLGEKALGTRAGTQLTSKLAGTSGKLIAKSIAKSLGPLTALAEVGVGMYQTTTDKDKRSEFTNKFLTNTREIQANISDTMGGGVTGNVMGAVAPSLIQNLNIDKMVDTFSDRNMGMLETGMRELGHVLSIPLTWGKTIGSVLGEAGDYVVDGFVTWDKKVKNAILDFTISDEEKKQTEFLKKSHKYRRSIELKIQKDGADSAKRRMNAFKEIEHTDIALKHVSERIASTFLRFEAELQTAKIGNMALYGQSAEQFSDAVHTGMEDYVKGVKKEQGYIDKQRHHILKSGNLNIAQRKMQLEKLSKEELDVHRKFATELMGMIGLYEQIPDVYMNTLQNKVRNFQVDNMFKGFAGNVDSVSKLVGSNLINSMQSFQTSLTQMSEEMMNISGVDLETLNKNKQQLNNDLKDLYSELPEELKNSGDSAIQTIKKIVSGQSKMSSLKNIDTSGLSGQIEQLSASEKQIEGFRNQINKFMSQAKNIDKADIDTVGKDKSVSNLLRGITTNKTVVEDYLGTDQLNNIVSGIESALGDADMTTALDKVSKLNDALFTANKKNKEQIEQKAKVLQNIKSLIIKNSSIIDGVNLQWEAMFKSGKAMQDQLNKLESTISNAMKIPDMSADVQAAQRQLQNVDKINNFMVAIGEGNDLINQHYDVYHKKLSLQLKGVTNAKAILESIGKNVDNPLDMIDDVKKTYSQAKNKTTGKNKELIGQTQGIHVRLFEEMAKVKTAKTPQEKQTAQNMVVQLQSSLAESMGKLKATGDKDVLAFVTSMEHLSSFLASAGGNVKVALENLDIKKAELLSQIVDYFNVFIGKLENSTKTIKATFGQWGQQFQESVTELSAMNFDFKNIDKKFQDWQSYISTEYQSSIEQQQKILENLTKNKASSIQKIIDAASAGGKTITNKEAEMEYEKRIFATRKALAETQIKASKNAMVMIDKFRDSLNRWVDLQQESVDIQMDVLQSVGGPIESIIGLEQQGVLLAEKKFQIELDALDKAEVANKLKIISEQDLQKQRNRAQKAEGELIKKRMGAQRSAMEKLLGSMIGSFSEVGAFKGMTTAGKFGAGFVRDAQGFVMQGGAEANKNAEKHGVRGLEDRRRLMGGGQDVIGGKLGGRNGVAAPQRMGGIGNLDFLNMTDKQQKQLKQGSNVSDVLTKKQQTLLKDKQKDVSSRKAIISMLNEKDALNKLVDNTAEMIQLISSIQDCVCSGKQMKIIRGQPTSVTHASVVPSLDIPRQEEIVIKQKKKNVEEEKKVIKQTVGKRTSTEVNSTKDKLRKKSPYSQKKFDELDEHFSDLFINSKSEQETKQIAKEYDKFQKDAKEQGVLSNDEFKKRSERDVKHTINRKQYGDTPVMDKEMIRSVAMRNKLNRDKNRNISQSNIADPTLKGGKLDFGGVRGGLGGLSSLGGTSFDMSHHVTKKLDKSLLHKQKRVSQYSKYRLNLQKNEVAKHNKVAVEPASVVSQSTIVPNDVANIVQPTHGKDVKKQNPLRGRTDSLNVGKSSAVTDVKFQEAIVKITFDNKMFKEEMVKILPEIIKQNANKIAGYIAPALGSRTGKQA